MKKIAFPALIRCLSINLTLGLILCCGACASHTPSQARLEPVRSLPPKSSGNLLGTDGFLVVDTPQELHFDKSSARRFPHTGYSIYTAQGHHLLQYVHNQTGTTGETPATVALPAGTYLIEARTVYHRPVSFYVPVRPQVATTVNLEGDLTPPSKINGEFYAVQFHGRTIGWAMETAARE